MEVNQHSPGCFSWAELATNNQNAAKKFYADLFGWDINDTPMGPDSFYTILQIRGKAVSALYQQDQNQISQGIPPNWLLYVTVANADESAAAITSAGGKIIMGPLDVFDYGRMAVAQDPLGAHFAVWEARNHIGASIMGEPNSMCWQELATSDPKRALEFYTAIFGWTPKKSQISDIDYTEFYIGDPAEGKAVGGMMQLDPAWGQVPPHWAVYFSVNDCDSSAKKAESLGGKVHVPPMDIPNVGRFAMIQDPQGAMFYVIKLNLG